MGNVPIPLVAAMVYWQSISIFNYCKYTTTNSYSPTNATNINQWIIAFTRGGTVTNRRVWSYVKGALSTTQNLQPRQDKRQ